MLRLERREASLSLGLRLTRGLSCGGHDNSSYR
jgi:hypothetical protein